jgi:hypothetical protein
VRKPLSFLLVATAAAAAFGLAPSASAVCGGGQPGEACYCPDGDLVNIKNVVVVRSPVNC